MAPAEIKDDFYEVLGLPSTATTSEIVKKYRELALQIHPDRNGGTAEATAAFQVLNEAHETLTDQSRRASYDKKLQAKKDSPSQPSPPRPQPPGAYPSWEDDLPRRYPPHARYGFHSFSELHRLFEEARRAAEEEVLRRREELRAREQAARDYDEAVRRSRAAEQEVREREDTCRHKGFWKKVVGQHVCSHCKQVQSRCVFECPGCEKLACADCRKLVRGELWWQGNGNRGRKR